MNKGKMKTTRVTQKEKLVEAAKEDHYDESTAIIDAKLKKLAMQPAS